MGVRSTGRYRELRVLENLLRSNAGGKGDVALITGAGGMGKSELLNAFREHAVESGAMVLTAEASRVERMVPMEIISQLFRFAALPSELAARVDALLEPETRGLGAGAFAMGQDSSKLVSGLCAVLGELARDTPLVLTVDDVHYADSLSLRLLLSIQRRMSTSRVMVVFTEWLQLRSVSPIFQAELTRQPRCTRIRIEPLSQADVEEMLAPELGVEAAARVACEYHAVSGGSPFLVRALVDDRNAAVEGGEDRGVADQGVIVGRHVEDAVVTCLHRWEPRLLEAARAVAMLGERASNASFVADLLGVKPGAVEHALIMLEEAGLLDGGRFRHPAVRDAVLADVSPHGNSAMHLRAAALVHQDGGASEDVANHLIVAGGVSDQWTADVLHDAARRALAKERLPLAVEYIQGARRACKDERRRAAITAMLVTAQGLVNPSAVQPLLQPLREANDQGLLNDREAITLSSHMLWHGRAEEAADTLGWYNAAVTDLEPGGAAELYLAREWLRFSYPPVIMAVTAVGQDPGVFPTSAGPLTDLVNNRQCEEFVGYAEQVLQSCRPEHTATEAVLTALLVLELSGKDAAALHWCDLLGREAKQSDARTWLAGIADFRSGVALRKGDLPAAHRFAHQALEEISAQSWGVMVGSPVAHLLMAATAMGNLDEAAELVRHILPEAIAGTRFWAEFLRARGRYYLACNRLQAALGDFLSCGSVLEKWGLDLPGYLPWRSEAAQVYLRLGRKQRARELLKAQMSRPSSAAPRVRGETLRVMAGTVEGAQRLAMLKEAVSQLQQCGSRLELTLALADLSQIHHSLGEVTAARLMTRRAKQLAKACRAEAMCQHLFVADVPDDKGETTGRSELLTSLSEAERRVVELAAVGHTNREIGRQLFITVSTVEQHLTRAYRKLNVSRRSDLARKLSSEELLDDQAASGA